MKRGWGVNCSEDARYCSVLYMCRYFVGKRILGGGTSKNITDVGVGGRLYHKTSRKGALYVFCWSDFCLIFMRLRGDINSYTASAARNIQNTLMLSAPKISG